jgi:hypothetical protein
MQASEKLLLEQRLTNRIAAVYRGTPADIFRAWKTGTRHREVNQPSARRHP